MITLIGAGPNTPVIGFGGTPGGLMVGETTLPAGTLVPVAGRDGHGLDIAGRVATYAALPSGLTVGDVGKAYYVDADQMVYIWSGTAWPASGSGAPVTGDAGPAGRGIDSITISGNNLVFSLSDATIESFPIPGLTEAAAAAAATATEVATEMAAIAGAAATLAVSTVDAASANRALAYAIALS